MIKWDLSVALRVLGLSQAVCRYVQTLMIWGLLPINQQQVFFDVSPRIGDEI